MNQPKWCLNSFQFDGFIIHDVFRASSRSPSNFVINGIGFEACHEINAFTREVFPPVVIGVATIHANHASWLVIEAFSHIDFMFFACSGNHEVGQIAFVIEAKNEA